MSAAAPQTATLLVRKPHLLDIPVSELIFVAFDTETTGRNPIASRLVEISGVKFRGNGEHLETRTHLINPGVPIPQEVTAIHGITDEMVQGVPLEADIIPDFINWMRAGLPGCQENDIPTIFVAHNAAFDVGFLQMTLSKLNLELPDNPVLDTLSLSRKLIRDSLNHKLQTLMEHLGINSSTYHRAEDDSFHVRDLMMTLFNRLGPGATLGSLIETGGVLHFSNPIAKDDDKAFKQDPLVKQIGLAIQAGHDLEIFYRGKGIRIRKITPLTVLTSSGNYYLNAFCHAAGSERTFRVDRIGKLEPVERVKLC